MTKSTKAIDFYYMAQVGTAHVSWLVTVFNTTILLSVRFPWLPYWVFLFVMPAVAVLGFAVIGYVVFQYKIYNRFNKLISESNPVLVEILERQDSMLKQLNEIQKSIKRK